VVTISLGLLKENNISFSPSLSTTKQRAIQRLGWGCINKIALEFEAPFWSVDSDFIWYTSSRDGYYPAAINWAKYVPGRYIRTLVANAITPLNRALLIFMTIGDFAIEMEHKADKQIVQELMAILSTIYPNASQPINYLITRWHSDPFAKGTDQSPFVTPLGPLR